MFWCIKFINIFYHLGKKTGLLWMIWLKLFRVFFFVIGYRSNRSITLANCKLFILCYFRSKLLKLLVSLDFLINRCYFFIDFSYQVVLLYTRTFCDFPAKTVTADKQFGLAPGPYIILKIYSADKFRVDLIKYHLWIPALYNKV